jgi:putative acetyltransferase
MEQITLKRTNSADPDFQSLIKQLDADLRLRNGDEMDEYDQHNIIAPIDTVVIAYADKEPVACGCFKKYNETTVEIKRMFVAPPARGKGISRKILAELETWAHTLGFGCIILETGGRQVEALALYQRAGYAPIANYPPYEKMEDSYCFRKELKKAGEV